MKHSWPSYHPGSNQTTSWNHPNLPHKRGTTAVQMSANLLQKRLHTTITIINKNVEMILPSGYRDPKCVLMTSPLDNTGPMQSEQIKQCPSLPILETRMKTNAWPTNTAMLKIIVQIIGSESPCPDKLEFCFVMMLEDAEKNFLVLKCYNFKLRMAIEAQLNSPVGYSSEF
jgi:hypothetical protein